MTTIVLQPIECHHVMEEYGITINGIDGSFRDHLIDFACHNVPQNSSFMAMHLESI
jgi:hypothetical protein